MLIKKRFIIEEHKRFIIVILKEILTNSNFFSTFANNKEKEKRVMNVNIK